MRYQIKEKQTRQALATMFVATRYTGDQEKKYNNPLFLGEEQKETKDNILTGTQMSLSKLFQFSCVHRQEMYW